MRRNGRKCGKEKENGTYTVRKKSIWKDKASWELLLLCAARSLGLYPVQLYPDGSRDHDSLQGLQIQQRNPGSEWVGLENFKWMVTSTSMGRILRNTVAYGAWFMIIGPITNMIIALLLFEVRSRKALKTYQTIITFPNFMSMVIVGYVTYAVLSPRGGLMNQILSLFGAQTVDAYMKPGYWPAILTIVNIWKGIGMGSMMYFASLMGIDPSLYEAAEIDGANRFQKMRYISLPHLIRWYAFSPYLGREA